MASFKLTLLTCIFIALPAAALECVSNAKTIALGDSVQHVLKTCGDADQTVQKTVTVPETHPVSNWSYLAQFNNQLTPSHAEPINIKLVIQFFQDKVDHISVLVPTDTDKDTEAFNLLGYLIVKGEGSKRVRAVLGQPQTIENTTATVEQKKTLIEALHYNDSDTSGQQEFVFNSGKLAAVNHIPATSSTINTSETP